MHREERLHRVAVAERHVGDRDVVAVEHGDGLAGVTLGNVTVGVVPVVHRQGVVVGRDASEVADALTQLHRPIGRGDGELEPVDEVVLLGQPLEQLGLPLERSEGPSVERQLQQGGRLATSAGPGRDPRRLRRVAQHAHRIAGADGVVGEDGGIGRGRLLQRGQHPLVQADLATRRDRAGDRQPAQVMAELDAAAAAPDQAGLVEGPQGRQPDAEPGEQVVGDRFRRARQQVDDLPGLGVEIGGAGQDGVAHRGRQLVTVVFEHRGDEERVAAGELLDAGGVDRSPGGELDDGLATQRAQCDRRGLGRAGDVAEQRPRRVVDRQLLGTEPDHHHAAGRPDASEEVPQQVDGALVGPVEVVDHEDGRLPPDVLEHCGEDLVRLLGLAERGA